MAIPGALIQPVNIEEEMKSYLDYSMSVISGARCPRP
jgi:DNA gyrase/topoisomerase IV subunit A